MIVSYGGHPTPTVEDLLRLLTVLPVEAVQTAVLVRGG